MNDRALFLPLPSIRFRWFILAFWWIARRFSLAKEEDFVVGDEDGDEFVVDDVVVAVVDDVVAVVVAVVVVDIVVDEVSFPEWMNVDTASGCLASANTIVSFLLFFFVGNGFRCSLLLVMWSKCFYPVLCSMCCLCGMCVFVCLRNCEYVWLLNNVKR